MVSYYIYRQQISMGRAEIHRRHAGRCRVDTLRILKHSHASELQSKNLSEQSTGKLYLALHIHFVKVARIWLHMYLRIFQRPAAHQATFLFVVVKLTVANRQQVLQNSNIVSLNYGYMYIENSQL